MHFFEVGLIMAVLGKDYKKIETSFKDYCIKAPQLYKVKKLAYFVAHTLFTRIIKA
jgi:hypothetical protein